MFEWIALRICACDCMFSCVFTKLCILCSVALTTVNKQLLLSLCLAFFQLPVVCPPYRNRHILFNFRYFWNGKSLLPPVIFVAIFLSVTASVQLILPVLWLYNLCMSLFANLSVRLTVFGNATANWDCATSVEFLAQNMIIHNFAMRNTDSRTEWLTDAVVTPIRNWPTKICSSSLTAPDFP